MTKNDAGRLCLLGIGALVLTGSAFAMHLLMRDPITPAPLGTSQRPHGKGPTFVQLEAPLEEVELDRDGAIAKQGGESEWVASGNPESIPLLVRYLKSQEELTQLAALAEFAGMGARAKRAVPAVVEALQDSKGSIRVQAAVTLIQMNVQAKVAIRALVRELQSEDEASRARAAAAIEALADPPPELFGSFCWGPDPPPRIARPWVRKAVEQAIK